MMSSEKLSNRARRLIYQASYTGMKETDLLLGHFAKVHLPELDDSELDDFEALLEVGDPIIYAWVMEKEPVPVQYDTRVFQLIKKFNKDREIIENIKNTIKLRLKKNFKII